MHEFSSVPDPAEALSRFSQLSHCLFLDSSRNIASETGQELGRYSFLMADPIDWIECHQVADCPDALERIDSLLDRHAADRLKGLPPMQGGLAGMVSYDFNQAMEAVAKPRCDQFETPLLAFGFYDVVLAWDHQQDRAWLISQPWNNAADRLQLFIKLLQPGPLPFGLNARESQTTETVSVDQQFPVRDRDGLVSNFSPQSYLAAVQQAIEHIYAGDIFQVNLAQRLLTAASGSSVDLYQKLRQCNPAPFGGYFDFGSGQIVSASPERLVSVVDGMIETRPIKGTRLRTGQPTVDDEVSRQLEHSEKDRAENIMIVDLMRNDLSRICTDDSVHVTQLCKVEQYQSVMHLVSAVQGRLTDNACRPSELLPAIFPAGSITGAPKVRSMEIIAELEPDARGAYCGSMGYFAANGDVDLNVLIRTIIASKGWWQLPVGGGIVSQSTPESEYEETWTKAAAMLEAIESVNRGEPN